MTLTSESPFGSEGWTRQPLKQLALPATPHERRRPRKDVELDGVK